MSSGICGRIVKSIDLLQNLVCNSDRRHRENKESSSLVISQGDVQLWNAGNADGISISPLHPSSGYLIVHLTSLTGLVLFFSLFTSSVIEC